MQVCCKKKIVRVEEVSGIGANKFVLHYYNGEKEELVVIRSKTTHKKGQKTTVNLLR